MKKGLKIIAFIFARGGSKGIVEKNLQQIGGLSLIARAVLQALAVEEIEQVVISTDCQKIADEAVAHGAQCFFMRPQSLASDTASEFDAWKHAVQWLQDSAIKFDIFVSVPATAPLRIPEDISNAISLYRDNEVDIVVTGSPAERSPYFNMLKIADDGSAELVCKGTDVTRRQDAPEVYDMTTVTYVMSPDYILNSASIWEGKVKLAVVPKDRAIDIDTPMDLVVARAFYNEEPSLYDKF